MNSDLFPKESQAEFKALAEILKIKSQIKTLESFETQEVAEEKFNLTESGEKEAILNPVCQKDERLTLKPQSAWLFNVKYKQSWLLLFKLHSYINTASENRTRVVGVEGRCADH